MKTWKSVLAPVLALLPLIMAGCFPGITWLPDSSGFVYSAGKEGERLMLFDLAKGSQQTLVADTKCKTIWPAVSPDGKRIAVARLVPEKEKGATLQVFIYDLQGKLSQRSSIFRIDDKSDKGVPTELFWAPNNKIVVSAWTDSGAVAIYDVKSDQVVTVKGAKAAAFGGKPFRPDNKGFLVTKEAKKANALSWVDWKGQERPIALNWPGNDTKELEEMLFWPSVCTSSWQGNKAIVFTSHARCEIDTDKLIGTCRLTELDSPNSENSVRQQFAFPNGSFILRVLTWTKRTAQGEDALSRLEIVDNREKKARTLRENSGCPILFPAPDGKHVAVLWLENRDGDTKQSILVLDQDAKTVAKFQLAD